MKCISGFDMSASKAIEYIQSMLSAEQEPSVDIQIKTSKNIDKMIEHMRSRLKSSSKLIYRNDDRRRSMLPEVQDLYAIGARPY